MADLPFISKSDLEIFKALMLANDINKKYSQNSLQTGSDIQSTISSEDVFFSDNSDFSSSTDSFCAYRTFKFDFEYETVGDDVDCINEMCDSFIEKNQLLEMQISSFIRDVSSSNVEIRCTKHLCKILEQINVTEKHILLICDKTYRILQVLQEKPYERTLKVNPSCQKSVLKFFAVANEIMEKLQQHVENIENYRSKNAAGMETHHKELQSRLHNKILELAKRIDTISQFREGLLPISTTNCDSGSNLDMLLC